MEKLKPCPFCGAIPILIHGVNNWEGLMCYWVLCSHCSGHTGGFSEEKDAVKAWNKRVKLADFMKKKMNGTRELIRYKDYKPISDMQLLALHMMASHKKDSLFFADVYAALSELIERRKSSGEWKGLDDNET